MLDGTPRRDGVDHWRPSVVTSSTFWIACISFLMRWSAQGGQQRVHLRMHTPRVSSITTIIGLDEYETQKYQFDSVMTRNRSTCFTSQNSAKASVGVESYLF